MKKIKMKFLSILSMVILLGSFSSYGQTFDQEIFKKRRQEAMSKMDGGVAVFMSPEVAKRNSDINYIYRQNSDFYYLTGFTEPQSIFILSPGAKYEFVMFVREKSPLLEKWTGEVSGLEGAMKMYGADTAYVYEDFYDKLPYYMRGKDVVYYDMSNEKFTEKLSEIFAFPRWMPTKINNSSKLISPMRMIKSEEEIKILQKAVDITSEAQIEAMKFVKPGMYEYEMKAMIEYVFAKNNSERVAFPSIVGSGPNATILHYEGQQRKMEDGDLLLMDVGAEYEYYSADITRTIPVNGKFTKEQKVLYETVLDIQEQGIELLKSGNGIMKAMSAMDSCAKVKLFKLGLTTDEDSEWQWLAWYLPFVCHWIGLDVHDVMGESIHSREGVILAPGMVTTIEPGLYINPRNLTNLSSLLKAYRMNVSEKEINEFANKVKPMVEKYANIGIRIEDDVLITENGNKILSDQVPKTVKDIENLMKKK